MALITCPECGKIISNSAHTCPNCGADKVSLLFPLDGLYVSDTVHVVKNKHNIFKGFSLNRNHEVLYWVCTTHEESFTRALTAEVYQNLHQYGTKTSEWKYHRYEITTENEADAVKNPQSYNIIIIKNEADYYGWSPLEYRPHGGYPPRDDFYQKIFSYDAEKATFPSYYYYNYFPVNSSEDSHDMVRTFEKVEIDEAEERRLYL